MVGDISAHTAKSTKIVMLAALLKDSLYNNAFNKLIDLNLTDDVWLNQVKRLKMCIAGSQSLTATGRHVPYGITQCYLPPDSSERAPP